jgi:hypothetical protein
MRAAPLRWLAILTLGFVFSETYLRFFHPVALMPRNVISSPYGIRVNKPDHTYWQVSPEYRVRIHTNSKGARSDVEFPYEKPAGVKRIVVLGDSFGMGFESDFDDTFLAQMARKLEDRSIHCEVVNLCVSGHGTAEELIMLQQEGVKYHPDLVLLAWNETDVEDNVRSALYRVADGRLERFQSSYLPGTRANEILSEIPGYTFLAENSQFYYFVRESVAGWMKQSLLDWRSKKPAAPAASVARPATPENHDEKQQGEDQQLTWLLLKEIDATCRSVSAKFLILDIPDQTPDGVFAPSPLAQIGDAGRIFTVADPLPALKQYRGGPLYWFAYHHHFTPAGSAIVGSVLADKILQDGLLK